MTLTYKEKLKIFHDVFIEHSWIYIERQKAMECGEEVPVMTTAFKENLSSFRIVPLVGRVADATLLINDLWNGRLSSPITASINKLFPSSKSIIKRMLSEAIQEIAIHVESRLNQLQDEQAIGEFATNAILKLINYLKTRNLDTPKLVCKDIVNAILKQNGYFTNDQFLRINPVDSNNYKFISEAEIIEYITNTNADNALSITTENDSTTILRARTLPISDTSIIVISEYIRTKYSLTSDKQIAVIREEREDSLNQDDSFLRYMIIGTTIDTDINSLRLDKHEEVIRRIEEKWEEEHNSLQQQSNIGFYNVRDAVHNFVGRQEILNQIHNCFIQGRSTIEIIGGLGGMGKTQAALQYVKEHKVEYDYRVRWFDAKSKASLDSSFRAFAKELGSYTDKKSDDQILKLVKDKLEKEIDQTLLVFDNVEDRSLVNQYLPNLGGIKQHHILITTRNTKDYDKYAVRSGEDIIRLAPLTEREALHYITTTLQKKREELDITFTDEDSIELAKLFNNIPLGLSQSIAYIENNLDSIREYITEYQRIKEQGGLPASLHDAEFEEEAGHVDNIYTTLLISLNALSAVPKAVEMLRLCSYLDANAIPEYLFDSLFETKKEKKDAIAILKGYSLISVKLEEDTKFIYIHRIVQEVTRFNLRDELSKYFKQAMELVHVQMEDCTETWDAVAVLKKNQPLMHHATSLIEYYRKETSDGSINNILGSNAANLCIDIGNLYSTLGQFHNAKMHYEEALTIRQIVYGEEHEFVAISLHSTASIYHILDYNDKALASEQQALLIFKARYGETHKYVALAHHSLGVIYQTKGNNDLALDHFDQALLIKREAYSIGSPSITATIRAIGNVKQVLGKYQEALEKYQEAYEIYKVRYGDTHPLVAVAANEIGTIRQDLGEEEEALTWHQRALQIKKDVFGDKHPSLAVNMNEIGNVYVALGRKYKESDDVRKAKEKYDEALAMFQKALAINEEAYGCDHTLVAMSMYALGNIYQVLGNNGDALVQLTNALRIFKASYGEEHREVAKTIHAIGNVYKMIGDHEKALEHFNKALVIKETVYEAGHQSIKITIDAIDKARYALEAIHIPDIIAGRSPFTLEITLGDNSQKDTAAMEIRVVANLYQALVIVKAVLNRSHSSFEERINQDTSNIKESLNQLQESLITLQEFYQSTGIFGQKLLHLEYELEELKRFLRSEQRSNADLDYLKGRLESFLNNNEQHDHVRWMQHIILYAYNLRPSELYARNLEFFDDIPREYINRDNSVALEAFYTLGIVSYSLEQKSKALVLFRMVLDNRHGISAHANDIAQRALGWIEHIERGETSVIEPIHTPENMMMSAIGKIYNNRVMDKERILQIIYKLLDMNQNAFSKLEYLRAFLSGRTSSAEEIVQNNIELSQILETTNDALADLSLMNIRRFVDFQESLNAYQEAFYALKPFLHRSQGNYERQYFLAAIYKLYESLALQSFLYRFENRERQALVAAISKLYEALTLNREMLTHLLRNYHRHDDCIFYVNHIKYDNSILNHSDLLIEVKQLGGPEMVNDLIEMGEDKELGDTIIEAIEQYGIKHVLSNLFPNKEELLEIQQTSDKDKILLATIENIKNIVGEKEIAESPGLYQYISNSLSNNQFSSSAKQMIKNIGCLINGLRELLDMNDYYQALGIKPDEQATLIWTQLEYLLEFAVSGQVFIGLFPKPPYFDPDVSTLFRTACYADFCISSYSTGDK